MMRKFLLSLLLLALTGCETVSVVTPTSSISPEHGLVIFKLSSNSQSIGFFNYWNTATIHNVDPAISAKYTILVAKKGNSRSAVYFGSLPEGEYRLAKFSSEQCGAMCVSSTLTVSDKLGTFSIQKGSMTDLGHLVYEQQDQNRSMIVHGESKRNWIKPYLQDFYPNVDASMADQDKLGWTTPDPARMRTAYNTVKKRSRGLIRPRETSDGTLLFGSYLGNVRVWTPGQGFRSYDTGIQGAIESVAELGPGIWVVGSEDGQVVISHNWGRTWRDYGKSFPNASVIGLNTYGGRLFATVHAGERLNIYYTNPDDEVWHTASSHQLEVSIWTASPRFPNSIAHEDKLVTSLPSKGLVVTNMNTLTFKERRFPGGIFTFGLSNDGILRCNAVKGIVGNPYESDDWGETWKRSTHSRFMMVPYFVDSRNGLGYQGAIAGKVTLATTEDGGVTWTNKGPFPYRTQYFSHLKATGTLFATDGHNSMVISDDNGATWQRP